MVPAIVKSQTSTILVQLSLGIVLYILIMIETMIQHILRIGPRELNSLAGTLHNICRGWGSNPGHPTYSS